MDYRSRRGGMIRHYLCIRIDEWILDIVSGRIKIKVSRRIKVKEYSMAELWMN
ncbi:MAG: hypothetical protein Q4E31_08010 [Intestinibacter bartlettii]|uniref:hypothetical protein n=1 Tax=Intestinibacter bartlettii TaxID=261299 RepID=UPI0026EBB3B8|nr:hypothetical protein [Intestinibacter bartlettii]MDO5010753.1 hypothetical protein [Intestinibacter bartlettii]